METKLNLLSLFIFLINIDDSQGNLQKGRTEIFCETHPLAQSGEFNSTKQECDLLINVDFVKDNEYNEDEAKIMCQRLTPWQFVESGRTIDKTTYCKYKLNTRCHPTEFNIYDTCFFVEKGSFLYEETNTKCDSNRGYSMYNLTSKDERFWISQFNSDKGLWIMGLSGTGKNRGTTNRDAELIRPKGNFLKKIAPGGSEIMKGNQQRGSVVCSRNITQSSEFYCSNITKMPFTDTPKQVQLDEIQTQRDHIIIYEEDDFGLTRVKMTCPEPLEDTRSQIWFYSEESNTTKRISSSDTNGTFLSFECRSHDDWKDSVNNESIKEVLCIDTDIICTIGKGPFNKASLMPFDNDTQKMVDATLHPTIDDYGRAEVIIECPKPMKDKKSQIWYYKQDVQDIGIKGAVEEEEATLKFNCQNEDFWTMANDFNIISEVACLEVPQFCLNNPKLFPFGKDTDDSDEKQIRRTEEINYEHVSFEEAKITVTCEAPGKDMKSQLIYYTSDDTYNKIEESETSDGASLTFYCSGSDQWKVEGIEFEVTKTKCVELPEQCTNNPDIMPFNTLKYITLSDQKPINASLNYLKKEFETASVTMVCPKPSPDKKSQLIYNLNNDEPQETFESANDEGMSITFNCKKSPEWIPEGETANVDSAICVEVKRYCTGDESLMPFTKNPSLISTTEQTRSYNIKYESDEFEVAKVTLTCENPNPYMKSQLLYKIEEDKVEEKTSDSTNGASLVFSCDKSDDWTLEGESIKITEVICIDKPLFCTNQTKTLPFTKTPASISLDQNVYTVVDYSFDYSSTNFEEAEITFRCNNPNTDMKSIIFFQQNGETNSLTGTETGNTLLLKCSKSNGWKPEGQGGNGIEDITEVVCVETAQLCSNNAATMPFNSSPTNLEPGQNPAGYDIKHSFTGFEEAKVSITCKNPTKDQKSILYAVIEDEKLLVPSDTANGVQLELSCSGMNEWSATINDKNGIVTDIYCVEELQTCLNEEEKLPFTKNPRSLAVRGEEAFSKYSLQYDSKGFESASITLTCADPSPNMKSVIRMLVDGQEKDLLESKNTGLAAEFECSSDNIWKYPSYGPTTEVVCIEVPLQCANIDAKMPFSNTAKLIQTDTPTVHLEVEYSPVAFEEAAVKLSCKAPQPPMYSQFFYHRTDKDELGKSDKDIGKDAVFTFSCTGGVWTLDDGADGIPVDEVICVQKLDPCEDDPSKMPFTDHPTSQEYDRVSQRVSEFLYNYEMGPSNTATVSIECKPKDTDHTTDIRVVYKNGKSTDTVQQSVAEFKCKENKWTYDGNEDEIKEVYCVEQEQLACPSSLPWAFSEKIRLAERVNCEIDGKGRIRGAIPKQPKEGYFGYNLLTLYDGSKSVLHESKPIYSLTCDSKSGKWLDYYDKIVEFADCIQYICFNCTKDVIDLVSLKPHPLLSDNNHPYEETLPMKRMASRLSEYGCEIAILQCENDKPPVQIRHKLKGDDRSPYSTWTNGKKNYTMEYECVEKDFWMMPRQPQKLENLPIEVIVCFDSFREINPIK